MGRIRDRDYSADVADMSGLSHPDHRDLMDAWLRLKPASGLPLKEQLDPTVFPRLLPRLAVIEAVRTDGPGDEGITFRYRLAGTEIVRRAGRDPTGRTFSELYEGDYLASARATYLDLMQRRAPHFSQRVFPIGEDGGEMRYDRLILPFSSDGETADFFLLLIVVISHTGQPIQEGSFSRYS